MSTTSRQEQAGDAIAVGISSLADAYRTMEMPVRRYLLVVVLPATVFFFATVGVAILAPLPAVVRMPIPGLGLLGLISAVLYPKLQQNKRKAEIGDRMHLFITHMTVLSSTNIDRVEVFRTLANEPEYKALADEMRRIVELVDTWNQSLDDACRMRAKKVPDKAFADFLERMAYTLNAGQDLNDFLLSEQDAIIRSYVTHYQSSLDNLEVLKDLYLSMILSMTFALVFATVLPILTGTDPTLVVVGVLMLFLIIQIGFLYTVRLMTPNDPVWYSHPDRSKPFERKLLAAVGASIVGVVAILGIGVSSALELPPVDAIAPDLYTAIPTPFYIAIPVTPLLIPGLLVRREEQRIRERDDEFATFIRALGATESVKQSTTEKVLETLRSRDFGPLTETINALYRRLNIRIDTDQAWDHFMTESRSFLIQKFSEMYVAGRQMGGDPKVLGELISKNMNEVLQLREQRKQSTVTFIGLLYGISAASAFAFFIGLEVVDVLAGLSEDLELTDLGVGQFIYPQVYNLPLIEYILLTIIVINAALSAFMIRAADDGHKVNTFVHFVLLTWIGATIAWLTGILIDVFLAV